jgi:ABC-2 type transport system ATP-binding protein
MIIVEISSRKKRLMIQSEENVIGVAENAVAGDAHVVADRITKRFGDRTAVDGVTFTIGRGEIFGLLGPNGAGKSTTVNILSTYLTPDSGQITIAGEAGTNRMAIKQHIGVVPQELALYDDLTARQNVDFFARIYGVPADERRPRTDDVLAQVGLEERADDFVTAFSGGMKRRLNLAVGMVHGPDFLMLDEPTVGVDPQSRQNIFDIVRRLKAAGTTILYTTHYMEEAEQLCDRIAIMDNGKIIAMGTLDELLRLQVEEIVVERPRGLEQLFIQLTGRRLRD